MTLKPQLRRVSIVCAAEHHSYCVEGCDCSCHAQILVKSKLTDLSYELWQASSIFQLSSILGESEDARQARLVDLIRDAASLVDLQGYTPEEVAKRLKGTLARDYWSLWETLQDLGIKSDSSK